MVPLRGGKKQLTFVLKLLRRCFTYPQYLKAPINISSTSSGYVSRGIYFKDLQIKFQLDFVVLKVEYLKMVLTNTQINEMIERQSKGKKMTK